MKIIELFDISNKIALVTGSSQGLGLSLATGLADARCKVILNGRNEEKKKDLTYRNTTNS